MTQSRDDFCCPNAPALATGSHYTEVRRSVVRTPYLLRLCVRNYFVHLHTSDVHNNVGSWGGYLHALTTVCSIRSVRSGKNLRPLCTCLIWRARNVVLDFAVNCFTGQHQAAHFTHTLRCGTVYRLPVKAKFQCQALSKVAYKNKNLSVHMKKLRKVGQCIAYTSIRLL
ncbi:hypothetical protein VTG60DRAFT_5460 [Thermothelomyces hinnuleus]